MKTPQVLRQLLQKPMDRKQFLQQTAAMTMFVAGGGAIVQGVTKSLTAQTQPRPTATNYGYGASAYGGHATPTTAAVPQPKQ